MNMEQSKSPPPLLGRYRLLKEKRKSTAYRAFLAYDLKLKRGVIVKLIPVVGFHKKYLPALWEYLEKTFKDEENVSRVVDLDFQNENLFVVEEYLEGKYFNSQIFSNRYDFERFETIFFRAADLIKRLHIRKAPHGFLDFTNMKLTPNEGIVLEDYPLLSWLEANHFLPHTSIPAAKTAPDIRDLRQLGLILFNVYRTQLVPEFGAFPEKYSRDDIYDFFRKTPFAKFSDIETLLAKLLLAGESKGFTKSDEAFTEIRNTLSTMPSPVQIRERVSPLAKAEKPITTQVEAIPKPVKGGPQELAKKLGRPIETPVEIEKKKPPEEVHEEVEERKPEIYTRAERRRESSRFKIFAWLTVLGFALLFAFLLLVGAQGFKAASLPEITVPEFSGLSFKEAEKRAEKLGLKMKINGEEYSEEMPEGMIIEHQPPPGTRTKAGRTIYVVVSKGLAVVTVPNLINQNETEAEANLMAFQLRLGKKEYMYSEDIPLGTVIDQTPSANEKVAVGETVNIIISAGLLKSKIAMPDLKEMSLSEALNAIEEAKLRIKKIDRSYSPYFEKESVTFQTPPAGEEIEYGMSVDLTVVIPLKDAPPDEFKISMSIKLPDFTDKKRVRITNRNLKSTREVYNQLHNGREQISLLADGYGRTTIRVYLDEDLIREETF